MIAFQTNVTLFTIPLTAIVIAVVQLVRIAGKSTACDHYTSSVITITVIEIYSPGSVETLKR